MSVNEKLSSVKKLSQTSIQYWAILGMLTALLAVLTACGLGFIRIGPSFSVTLFPILVAIAATSLGPSGGTVMGFIFGTASLIAGITGVDTTGAAMFAINPIKSTLACYVPRIIMGFLCGVIFKLADNAVKKHDKPNFISHCAACASAALLNTLLFLFSVWLFFGNEPIVLEITGGSRNFLILLAVFAVNALIELAINITVGTAISKTIEKVNRVYAPGQQS